MIYKQYKGDRMRSAIPGNSPMQKQPFSWEELKSGGKRVIERVRDLPYILSPKYTYSPKDYLKKVKKSWKYYSQSEKDKRAKQKISKL